MRVAFINHRGSSWAGAEDNLRLIVTNLPADIEPVMVLFEDGAFADRLRDLGLPTHIVAVNERLATSVLSWRAVGLPAAINQLGSFFQREPVAVVHTNTFTAHMVAAPAARLLGIPAVMHLHDMNGRLGRLGLRLVAAGCTSEQIAVSQAVRDWYAMPNTSVIGNPIDLAQYETLPSRSEAKSLLGIPDDDVPLIGIVGRIDPWKGQETFLRVAAAVNAKQPIRCAIVGDSRFGDTEFVPKLRQLAADLGIGNRTIFVPWLDDPRVAYAALDVLCNCSIREPFGRSTVEAAAAGVPAVAFDDGGAVDIITDGYDGCLVPAGNTDAFGIGVLRLVVDREYWKSTAANARSTSARYAAPANAALVAAVLRRSALTARGAPDARSLAAR